MRAAIDVDQFRLRLVADVVQSAMPAYYERRAEAFEWARLRRSDYTGQATLHDLHAAFVRCDAIARACRTHAEFLRSHQTTPDERAAYADAAETAEADLRRALDTGNGAAAAAAGLLVDALEAAGAWRTPTSVELVA